MPAIVKNEPAEGCLFNTPAEFVKRFRKQVNQACCQERPTPFRDYMLHDPGAFPDLPLSGKLTWRVTHPETEPESEKERGQKLKFSALVERMEKAVEAKRK